MTVVVKISDCVHISNMSVYNHNYYSLPFHINGCHILYEEYDGAEEYCGSSIGILDGEGYHPKYWLHTSNQYEQFVFDDDCLKDHNEWT